MEITKLEKKLSEGESSKFRGMTKSEIEFEILKLAKHTQDITSTKKMDEELNSAREALKELNAPYVEQSSHTKLRSRFLHLLLKEKELE